MSLLAFWLSLYTIVKNEMKRKKNKQNQQQQTKEPSLNSLS